MSLNLCAHGPHRRTISWDVPLSHAHPCNIHMGCPISGNMSHSVRGPIWLKYLLGCTLPPYCPTALLLYCLTALPLYCPATLSPYHSTTLPPYHSNILLHHDVYAEMLEYDQK